MHYGKTVTLVGKITSAGNPIKGLKIKVVASINI